MQRSDRRDPTEQTLSYYEENAGRLTAGYEAVDLSATLERIAGHLRSGARVLEIGCGSGRDAAWFLARGFEVTALDGSQAMADRAVELHPELADRIRVVRLPAALPFEDGAFDAVVSLATIMHLSKSAIGGVLGECRRVLTPGGVCAVSVPTSRPDLDAGGVDARGRQFTLLAAPHWDGLLRAAGLEPAEAWETDDAAGRAGIRWYTALCRVGLTG